MSRIVTGGFLAEILKRRGWRLLVRRSEHCAFQSPVDPTLIVAFLCKDWPLTETELQRLMEQCGLTWEDLTPRGRTK